MALKDYQKKRDFTVTPEPKGTTRAGKSGKRKTGKGKTVKTGTGPLRFVIQKHWARRLHYDLRLEMDGVLKSWAVPKGPSLNPDDKRLAEAVEDHPLDYIDFEGIIPEGYGAGTVQIWDRGFYYIDEQKSREENEKLALEGLSKGTLKLNLQGQRLKGNFAIFRMQKSSWLLKREMSEGKHSTVFPALIGVQDLKKERFPGKIQPMMATLVDKSFSDDNYLYEIKFDGYRTLTSIKNGKADLYSRTGQAFNSKYPEVKEQLEQAFREMSAVLDGEMVVLDEKGRPRFQLLQSYGREDSGFLVYYIFDILHLEGYDLKPLPLRKRKEILRELIPHLPNVRYVGDVQTKGETFFRQTVKAGIEGIVAKRLLSRYQPGKRTHDWLKVKRHMRQEAVIGAYTEPRGGRKKIGAIVIGVYEKPPARQASASDRHSSLSAARSKRRQAGNRSGLTYVGHVSAGQAQADLDNMFRLLKKIERKKSPFREVFKANEKVHYVEPTYVCEVKFSEWTKDGQMRQPILLGIRQDKIPLEVHRELPDRPPIN